MNFSDFETRAIHAGQSPDATTGAVIPPIYQVSTFKQDGVGGFRNGYEYSRSANPTRTVLEDALAALEASELPATVQNQVRGFAFGSGLAAEDALLRAMLRPGDHLIVPNDAYGGSYRLINQVFGQWGIEHTPVDLQDLPAIQAALKPNTKAIWVETPTNPLLSVVDIAAVAQIAHAADALLVVDNTFATPYLQQPLALGADAVVHSLTKYLGGHSDVVGGGVIVKPQEVAPDLAEQVGFYQNAAGAVAGPFDAWLVLRGIKTLPVRMDRHSENAKAVVQLLSAHPRVTKVLYPGLSTHPNHDVAVKQMRDFGGMVSFQIDGGETEVRELVNRTQVFTLAESLGGVESLIEYPAAMTHASVAGSELEVPDNLIRLSVGIESAKDLVADLKTALG